MKSYLSVIYSRKPKRIILDVQKHGFFTGSLKNSSLGMLVLFIHPIVILQLLCSRHCARLLIKIGEQKKIVSAPRYQ